MITVAFQLPWIVSTVHLLHGLAYFGLLVGIAYLTRPVTAMIRRSGWAARSVS
jgi:heme A synthase